MTPQARLPKLDGRKPPHLWSVTVLDGFQVAEKNRLELADQGIALVWTSGQNGRQHALEDLEGDACHPRPLVG